ncbi:C40 family peptidase [Streptomyces xanthochromogenes]|uniref:Glycoside hydrolase n=1 Tax=Streptomyces xanthochromogenes TaxID=67384 RepID=A0ABQ3AU46_9ACTN|nr:MULTISPECIES: C40 family peptidase [Streptomyces]MYV92788.1 glycoside hydrolase [Streptomyces sp. SID1034]GGY65439.1 glycoside hydrolase [Streptomyces xanthochromogenes]
MSHTAHIPSHRKPRRSASKVSLRAGVAGGVLSTIALAGAAAPAIAAQPVNETIEMPTLTGDLATTAAATAQATKAVAADLQLQAAQDAAASSAAKDAKKAKDDAEKKAAEAKAKADAEAKAKADAAERASRSAERTSLKSSSSSTGGTSTGTTSFKASNATGSAAAIVNFALAQVGKAYVSGATGSSAYDCSGLVQAAYRQAGIDLPRVSQDQSMAGTDVSLSNLQPGDILYWGGKGSAYHVAIYVGGGNFVGAQNPSTGVVERGLDYDSPSGAVRVL